MAKVLNQFHDDWLLWTIYDDGSVRQLNTEMMWEHGQKSNWARVMRVVRNDEPRFAGQLLRFALEVPNITQAEFFSLLNDWVLTLEDHDMGFAGGAR